MINLLLFLFCYVGGFVLALFVSPVWSFMLYEVTYFMSPLDRWWAYMLPTMSYSLFTVVLMGIVFFIRYGAHRQNKLLRAPPLKWVYLLSASYLLATLYASDPVANQEAAINFAKLAIIISLAYKLIDSRQKLDGVIYAFIAGAAYIGFVIYQTGRDFTGRVSGVGTVDAPDSNDVAAAIAPALILTIFYFWSNRSKLGKLGLTVAGAFIANALVLINSRGGFLAAIGGFLFLAMRLFFAKRQRRFQRPSIIVLIVLTAVGGIVVVDDSAVNRFRSIQEEQMTGEEETGATRLFFWMAAVRMAEDFPLGAGANGFVIHSPAYIPEGIASGASRNRAVHSSWFEALTETGFHGLFFAAMILISTMLCLRRCRRLLSGTDHVDDYNRVIAIEAAVVTYAIAMTFLNRMRAEVFYWCVLYAACAYNLYVVRRIAVAAKPQPASVPRAAGPLNVGAARAAAPGVGARSLAVKTRETP
jgi:hypothetical protein